MLIGGVCGAGAVVVVAILGRRGQKTVSRCGALVFGVGTGPKNFLKNKILKNELFISKKIRNYLCMTSVMPMSKRRMIVRRTPMTIPTVPLESALLSSMAWGKLLGSAGYVLMLMSMGATST